MALKRKVRDFNFRLKEITDEGEFSGYGSVFDVVDYYREVVARGAFAASLKEWEAEDRLPPVLWQHNSHEPVGPFTKMLEDQKGLYLEGRLLVRDVQRAREARALMEAKAISGLSIGIDVVIDEWNKETQLLTLKQVNLWEVSIVTFPANEAARVEQVKSFFATLADGLPSLKEFEAFLREAGFSKSHATAITSKGLGPLLREVESGTADPVDVKSMIGEVLAVKTVRKPLITLEDILP